MRSRFKMAGLVAISVSLACHEYSENPSGLAAKREWITAENMEIRPAEQFLFDVAKKAPSFGGFWMDTEGVVHLWVADKDHDQSAEAAVSELFSSGRLPQTKQSTVRGFRVERGAYSIPQLARWRDLVFDAANMERIADWVSLDMDERLNRVRLVLSNEQALKAAGLTLSELGVPLDAVELQIGAPMRWASASVTPTHRSAVTTFAPNRINDQVGQIVGGVGIGWHATGGGWGGPCTLGLAALTPSGPRAVTASHCSPTVWGVDGTLLSQAPNGRSIATEVQDAAGYTCGIRTCRGSDAALYSYTSGILSLPGLIARMQGDGSDYWDQTNSYWQVFGVETNNIYSGLWLRKNGSTTGQVSAQVYNTCDDYAAPNSRTVTCQMDANGGNLGGDSGGPLFWERGAPYIDQVIVAGMTVALGWTGNIIFSPFQRIAANTGLTVFDVRDSSLFPAQPSISGTVSGGYAQVSWSSVPTAVSYTLYRQWYVYGTGAGSNGWENLGSVSSPFTDTIQVAAYTGTTFPNFSTPGYASYYLIANNGTNDSQPSVIKHFRLPP